VQAQARRLHSSQLVVEMDSVVTCLRDSHLIWRFQEFFGVEKLQQVEHRQGNAWVAVQAKQQTHLVEHGEGTTSSLAREEHNCKQRTKGSKLIEEESFNVNSSGYSSEGDEEGGEKDNKKSSRGDKNIIYYKIHNQFWYFLFLLGSQLGDEAFSALFFSFWFWNLDSSVGRRLVLVWNIVMYIGQGLKDIIRWPRPSMPPVVQLEQKWALEYGMPSTHAMIGLAVPTSAVIFTMAKYEFSPVVGGSILSTWCCLVCCSRMYLGMHSLADILAGLVLSGLLLLWVVPLVHYGDSFLVCSPLAPAVTVPLSILAIWYYPGSDRWTPARGDTTAALGCYLGVQLGVWLNYQLGFLHHPAGSNQYLIQLPALTEAGLMLLRVIIGGLIAVLTRAVFKPLTYHAACYFLNTDKTTLSKQEYHISNKEKLAADLFYKFLTWLAVCFTVVFISPLTFRLLGCDRVSFYTELSL